MKLFYNTYKDNDSILSIDLGNGYTIIAIKSKNEDGYSVEYRIKDNTVELWDLIEPLENYTFQISETKIINKAILKHVSTLYEDGFFEYYIRRLDYMFNCFDIGNTVMENN